MQSRTVAPTHEPRPSRRAARPIAGIGRRTSRARRATTSIAAGRRAGTAWPTRACCRSARRDCSRARCAGRARPAPSGRRWRSVRCARARRASSRPARGRRPNRSTSAARSSRRRPRTGTTATRRLRTSRRRRRARRPAGRRRSIMTPVEVSLWVSAHTSTPEVSTGAGWVPGCAPDDLGLVEVRSPSGGVGELARELAEHEVLAAGVDQPERGDVPERGRAAVAEHDLPSVGEGEELAQPGADLPHHVTHRSLPVRGAHPVPTGRCERLHGLGADLGRTAPEAAVARQERGRYLQARDGGHCASMRHRDPHLQAPHLPTDRVDRRVGHPGRRRQGQGAQGGRART